MNEPSASDGQIQASHHQALTNRGSLTFWIDEQAIILWCSTEHHGGQGREFQYSDTAIETTLMLKGRLNLPLRH